MRQSVAPNRASVTQGGSSAATLSKLTEKKKEYDAVSALERASALYLERLEALGDDCDIMADAGEVHGQVLAQWPKMFQILSQFLLSRVKDNGEDEVNDPLQTEGQRLIRVPIETLQEANADKLDKYRLS